MDVKQIVREYLEKNGYDGLYSENGRCGCDFEDFMPCGFQDTFCVAAHKEKPAPDSEFQTATGSWCRGRGRKGGRRDDANDEI